MMRTLQAFSIQALALLLFLICGTSGTVSAQNGQVSGLIRGERNEPLQGVSVILKGTTRGAISDERGLFAISIDSPNDTLTFRYLGYEDEDIAIEGRSKIDLTMQPNTLTLEEVAVIGYGEQKKIEVTGATSSIEATDITKLSSANFQESFQGLMAGVNVASGDGNPGAPPTITIRGISSALDIGDANQPLFVVDGIPYQGVPNISPNEIERVDVLKDAASAAIYGTRGSNGVILITTKRAKAGEMKVDFNAYYGMQTLSEGVELMNTTDFLFYERSWLLNMTTPDNIVYLDDFRNQNFDVSANTDWIDVFQNPTPSIQNYNLGLSGGNKQLSYNVNLNRFDQEGMFINSNFGRTSIRATTQFEKNKFKVRTTLNLQNRNRDELTRNLFRNAINMTPARDVPDFEAEEFEAALGGRSNDNQIVQLIRIVKDRSEFTENELFGAVRMDYEILDGLTVAANLGGRYTSQRREVFRPSFVLVDPEGFVVDQNNSSNLISRYEQRIIERSRYTGDISLNYKKQFGGHDVNAFVLYSRERFSRNTINAQLSGFTSNEAMVISNSTNPPILAGDKDAQAITSTLGRVQYDYKDKYLLSASIRRDGASVFPEANRYGVFPSFSVGYNLAKEEFFRKVIPQRIVNGFKIRYGYGQTGNSRINSFVYIPTVTSNIDYILGGDILQSGTTISDIFNENDLRWETSIQNNLGFDMSFFRSRFTLAVDLYNKRSQDLLFPLNIPGSAGTGFTGNSTVIKNVGDIENRGIEIAARYRGRIGKDLSYNIRGTFTKNVNTVLKMGTPGQVIYGGRFTNTTDAVTAIQEGYPVGSFFVIPANGVIQTQDDLERARAYQPSAKYGDLMYQDTNGDGTLDDNDRVYAGTPNPEFEAGFNVNLRYKAFDLSVSLYGVYGNTLFNGAKYYAYDRQRYKELINMWSFENPESDIPVPTRANNSRAWSDYWLEDGSYLRVRNINFGYTVPSFLKIDNARVYVSMINPFTFTKYTGFDPEVGGSLLFQGVDRTNYPLTKRFLFGVQIGF
ncbi:TonB-dependent receptor [Pontibacter sp. G13]|uniref:SusC/RagA family TonB-linked outer membrane protein n=1 Tax=Pontibacter sp. G13 TaxID=3074898 RepID=UPI00288BB372|nr:TonB-dependent receptor [Pontibacter sp. G13]WNJ16557.1 TonB-dependent receptor [Pontibacter sp. G13]